MSTTIDQRVVEMRFDNKQFESGVSTTMSTIDKLKKSLNFTGATKGLENVGAAAKKVDMNGLGAAVDTVRARFSALDVMGVTALANITNSAVNAGKRIVSALTIDPIKTGFQEYETQMNAVQTILANTQSKGSTLDDVNKALDTLNEYADKTIYNFTEMTRNIGTFTAAGVDLQTSVDSIKGIANLAAVSGSSSQQASTAMYQLSQALAAGRVSLMDWNSVVNAGMGGELFQNALIRTSELLKTGAKDAISTYGSFRESLTKGEWLTTEVLTETLKQISGAYTEAELISQGFTKEQAKEIAQLAETADNAATKVKTFSQLWDVMKESAQSGWAQTWKIIVGDFEEAKALLTPLADFFTGIIGKISDARNDLLESALGRGIGDLSKKINSLLEPAKGAAEAVTKTVDAIGNLDEIAGKVINGDFGNGTDRFNALTEAGINYYRVQNKVNEALGDSFRHSEETIANQDKLLGVQDKSVKKTEEQATETKKLTEANKEQLKRLAQMTEEQLKNKGYTDEQIESLKELGRQADKLGVPLGEFIDNLDQINGRWLLINSFKNIGKGLISVFTSIKNAWVDVFPPKSLEERAEGLFNLIAALSRFTNNVRTTLVDSGDEITRTFKGIFAAIDIVLTVVGGPLKIAFKAFTQLLGALDLNIFDVTASIGDVIVKFRDWIDSTLDFTKAFEKLATPIKNGVKSFREWIETLKTSENLPQDIAKGIMNGLEKAVGFVKDLFVSFKESIKSGLSGASGDFVSGFVNGIKTGISTIIQTIIELGKLIIEKFRLSLDEHSPSKASHEAGVDFVQGFINGFKELSGGAWEAIKAFGAKCIEFLSNIDWGAVFAGGTIVFALASFWKIANTIEALTDPLEGLGDVLKNTAKVVESFSGVLNAYAMSVRAEALKSIAIAIAILVGSIIALTLVDPERLWPAVGVIVVIGTVLTSLALAISNFENKTKGLDGLTSAGTTIAKFAALVLSVSASVLLLAFAAKLFAGMTWNDLGQAGAAIGGIAVIMTGLIAATKLAGKDMDKVGGTLFKMAAAIGVLAIVAKLLASMTWDELGRAGAAMGGLTAIVTALVLVTKIAGKNVDKLGSIFMQMAGAIAILVIVAKMLAKMTWADMGKAAVGLLGFVGIIGLLTLITKMAGPGTMSKLGSTLIMLSGAIAILAMTARLISGMTWEEMGKAAVGITALGGIIVGLIAATKLAKGRLKQVGSTLLMLSASILLLAVSATLLGLISIENLTKGVVAVAALGAVMSLMITATKGAKNCHKNIMMMAIAIGVMAAAVALLSMIDGSRIANASAALGLVMGMFGVMIAATQNATKAMGTLIVLTVAIGVIAGALYLLTRLAPEEALASAVGLSAVMLAVSGALAIVSKVGATIKNALMGVLALTAMAVPMLAFIGVLALMQNIQGATTNALALGGLMAAMTAMLIPLTIIGSFIASAILGVVSLTAMAVPLFAFIGALAVMQHISGAEENAKLLMDLMKTMTAVLVVVSVVGPLASMGVAGIVALTKVMLVIGALAVAIGAVMTYIPSIQTFLDSGVSVLNQLANAVGSMVGNLIDGFLDASTQSLPEIGTRLSEFMTNITPFINGVKMVDESALTGAKVLAGAILALTAADMMAGIASFLQGGSSLPTLGLELSAFMKNALPFIIGASAINPAMMEGVNAMAETILLLTSANILEGLTSWFTGGSSLTAFSAQLPQLGTDLAAFATNLGTFDEAKVTTVTCAANAIKAIASAADSLPNEGGWISKIVGDNAISEFGSSLPDLAKYITGFATNLGTFDDSKVSIVTCACNAIKSLAEAAGALPNEGGWLGKIVGENGIDEFGTKLPGLATNLSSFVTNLGTFDESKISTVDCAGKAISALANAASSLPNEGGWLGKIVGENGLDEFGTKLPAVGKGLKGFVSNLGTFTDAQVTAVTKAVSAINALSKLSSVDNISNLSYVSENIAYFGEQIGSFVGTISGIGSDNISAAIDSTNDIVEMAQSAADTNIESLKTFGKTLKDSAKDGITGFVDAFEDDKNVTKVEKGASSLAKAAANAIKTVENQDKMAKAGSYLVTGLANGIKDNQSKAVNAAVDMVKKAIRAAEEAADINSPSKEFYRIGDFSGMGFVNALRDYGSKSYAAGSQMADFAKSGLRDAVSRIAEVVDSDMDLNPVVAPVLDLSNIRSGAGAIDSMFGYGLPVSVLTSVNSASRMMNQRNQNGVNADVVSAINKLRKDVGSMERPSYNINGITYDDGSAVSDAIKVLVRAAKVEGRV